MNMIEVKTQDLTGDALDWAVAQAIGAYRGDYRFSENGPPDKAWIFPDGVPLNATTGKFKPSTDWAHGGPLIESRTVTVAPYSVSVSGAAHFWVAEPWPEIEAPIDGPTPLIAACRAIVAGKLGVVVSIPAELIQQ